MRASIMYGNISRAWFVNYGWSSNPPAQALLPSYFLAGGIMANVLILKELRRALRQRPPALPCPGKPRTRANTQRRLCVCPPQAHMRQIQRDSSTHVSRRTGAFPYNR